MGLLRAFEAMRTFSVIPAPTVLQTPIKNSTIALFFSKSSRRAFGIKLGDTT